MGISKDTIVLTIVILLVGVGLGALILINPHNQGEKGTSISFQQAMEYASKLQSQELYRAAVDEFKKIVENYELPDAQRENILFNIGNIYRENIRDYRNALRYYYLLEQLYPDFDMKDDLDKYIIECLDRLGRSAQAQTKLDKTVNLGHKVSNVSSSEMIAKIGDRAITRDDLAVWLDELPPYISKNYDTPEKKMEFLKQKVSEQLLYDAALRAGYDRRDDVAKAIDQATRQILASAYIQDNLGKPSVSPDEMKAFYDGHKDIFGNKPFDEMKDSVSTVLGKQKMLEAQFKLSQKLFSAENVEFYPQNLGIK